jgi:nucleotide-binding universal stress UspA family protein
MGRSIVCGVDDSPDARAVLGVAARLAEQLERKLVLIHVIPFAHASDPAIGGGMGAGPVAPHTMLSVSSREREARAERLLAQLTEEMGISDVQRRVVTGFPAERLADVADEEDAELIVVGSRGRGAFKAAFLGSVSNSLIGVARCPVVIVAPGVAESAYMSAA